MTTSNMTRKVERFLRYRRDLGYTSRNLEWHLRSFARFAAEQGHAGPPTMDLMRAWVLKTNTGRRWTSLRKFCEFLAVTEPATEVPAKKLGRKSQPRVQPFIYTLAQIQALLKAARNLGPTGTARGLTYATYFGLMAATGMRPGEVMRLKPQDIDWKAGAISIRDSKGNRLRVIPVHRTVSAHAGLHSIGACRAHRLLRHSRGLPRVPDLP